MALSVKGLYAEFTLAKWGEGKTMYTFTVSVNAFSVQFLLACYQQAGRVWYVSGALRRMYMLFYPAPAKCTSKTGQEKPS